ncbi:MAG: 4Fe-4S binding protein [Dehalococcoidia bacterium]|jgi:ferredoxin|nr:4Fe-4S binding protein [Dehalococcoidia bacterium]
MTYYTTSACIDEANQMCVDICPVDCVHIEDGVDRIAFIDPDGCIDCGACEPACPISAIYSEAALPESMAIFAKIHPLYFTDREAARAMVGEALPVPS